MKSRLIATMSIAALALAACGGGGGSQDEVADMVIEQLEADGVDADEDCVRDAAGELSDEDAEKILEAGSDGEADVSDDAEAAASQLMSCVDMGSVVDSAIDDMVAEMGEENVDADCIREATADLDMAALEEGGGDLMTAMMECITIDVGG